MDRTASTAATTSSRCTEHAAHTLPNTVSMVRAARRLMMLGITCALTGCIGDGNPSYTIGGTVTGLQAQGLVLQNNGGDDISIAPGASVSFQFATSLSGGAPYAVTIKSQPSGWTQACDVTNGSGTVVGSAVDNITISCSQARAKVTTLAGTTTAGASDGVGAAASFRLPVGVAVGDSGNVYVAEFGNNLIRKVTPTGSVTTVAGSTTAGSTNGTGAAASFNKPTGLAIDPTGTLYVADLANNLIRKITPAGAVTTFAGSGSAGSSDGLGTAASFRGPIGIAIDSNGNLYVADVSNNMIRKITPQGLVSTLAGSTTAGSSDGTGAAASFKQPTAVAVDNNGNLYVTDTGNSMIRKVTPNGVVTTLAGSTSVGSADGTGPAASFNQPVGLAVDSTGTLYVADSQNNLIRKVTPAGVVTTLAGSTTAGSADGIGAAASFSMPSGIALDSSTNLYVGDSVNNLIRKIERVR